MADIVYLWAVRSTFCADLKANMRVDEVRFQAAATDCFHFVTNAVDPSGRRPPALLL